MNMVHVEVWRGGYWLRTSFTDNVDLAMEIAHEAWNYGLTCKFVGPFGTRILEPPIENLISQLPDDSQARHDRNRARWKSYE